MKSFLSLLTKHSPEDLTDRRWVFVPYDQLTDRVGPLATTPPASLGIILIENRWKAERRPYHQQKLALVLSNMRHFALEQARRGVAVRYLYTDGCYRDALRQVAEELGPITMMRPAEYELRADLAALFAEGLLVEVPHEGWLTTRDDFLRGAGAKPPWRQDKFYRQVRQRTGLLMTDDGKPMNGRYSFDGDNREFWPGTPAAPEPPTFSTDCAIKQEVADLIRTTFPDHPGAVDLATLPATQADAQRLWAWAKAECMTHFGPYEDAMSTQSRGVFHTRVSPLLNLHRLLPAQVIDDVVEMDIPFNSKEGFVRQVIGWREFVHHVHEETDGFRNLDGVAVQEHPGDGGYAQWAGKPWAARKADHVDGGADPHHLEGDMPVPQAWWGKPSGLRCLDEVVKDLWDEGWTHHIPRLMILANFATLLGVSPRSLTDWFWVAYIDAYDWVVEPNVLGMGTFSVGPVMTTKPYVSGAPYVNRMSNYCKKCPFHPSKTCPVSNLYWAFMARNRETLSDIFRIKRLLGNLDRRSERKKAQDQQIYQLLRRRFSEGLPVSPEMIARETS